MVMRKQLYSAAIAAFLVSGAPTIAIAQETPATPQENLDCAVWAAVMLDSTTDSEAKVGLGYAFTWFIGLYEGQTSDIIDTAILERSNAMSAEDVQAVHDGCYPRMLAFGERLQSWDKNSEPQSN